MSKSRTVCWNCGHDALIWDSDSSFDEIYGDGRNGVVSFLHCSNCKSEVEYSKNFEEEDDGN